MIDLVFALFSIFSQSISVGRRPLGQDPSSVDAWCLCLAVCQFVHNGWWLSPLKMLWKQEISEQKPPDVWSFEWFSSVWLVGFFRYVWLALNFLLLSPTAREEKQTKTLVMEFIRRRSIWKLVKEAYHTVKLLKTPTIHTYTQQVHFGIFERT